MKYTIQIEGICRQGAIRQYRHFLKHRYRNVVLGQFPGVAETRILLGEEAVNRLSAKLIKVVLLLELYHLYAVALPVEIVDSSYRWMLLCWNVMCPISRSRDQQHRLGREHCGDFNVACAVPESGRILAEVAPLHDGRDHVDRRSKLYPIIHGRQQKSLRAATGCTSDSQPGCIHVIQRCKKIQRPNGVPKLQAQRTEGP